MGEGRQLVNATAEQIRELDELIDALRDKQAAALTAAEVAAVAAHIVTLQAEQRRLIRLLVR